jgi:hypothetical protein
LPAHLVAPGEHTPVQVPPKHAWLTHATAVPQVPANVQVSTPLLLGSHWVVPGAQTCMMLPWQTLLLWHALQFVVQAPAF